MLRLSFRAHPRTLFARFLPAVLLAASAGIASAAEPVADDAAGLELFEAKIRPVLVTHCYECHSESGKMAEGNLRVDSRESLREGGDRGPAVVPGEPDVSILLTAIEHAESDLKMPPKKDRLPAQVIADFRRWIELGAPDPRDAEAAKLGPVDIAAGRKFWSYREPVVAARPESRDKDWSRTKLDGFILARLEAAELEPTPDAEPHVLLRRLHFDLHGLPPSPKAIREFAERVKAEGIEPALAAEVDALLASPRFGEHWGRHWLDVARFAESSGKEANMTFPYAWRYRDYVIDAVNEDIPYDRFLLEQIAGDLLPAENDHERARLLIATGFLAFGPKNLDEADEKQFAADVIDEQIDTVSRAVLGASIACARCHDDKFEPYSMPDYYDLAGVF